ncbi:hypothetical protein NHP21005_07160 [Helicobacter sp. NHP21005]|uniref:hypothetical protein n=1 Tax=Helicobacter felistomachi TaxID=3040201 RepID=UPI0025729E75|nr:hypothetical protein [Helicobacter sp. NHP21005]BEG57028.1 hypothetical protein NHP21005_07160 [Helicobacter sp. NHP21005]
MKKEHTQGPCAFCYPRGAFLLEEGVFAPKEYVYGKCELLKAEGDILFVGYGNGVGRAYETLSNKPYKSTQPA